MVNLLPVFESEIAYSSLIAPKLLKEYDEQDFTAKNRDMIKENATAISGKDVSFKSQNEYIQQKQDDNSLIHTHTNIVEETKSETSIKKIHEIIVNEGLSFFTLGYVKYIPYVSEALDYAIGNHIINMAAVRAEYKLLVNQIHQKYQEKLQSNEEISEGFARELFTLRNDAKLLARKETGSLELSIIYLRNLLLGYQKDGVSFDDLLKKGKTFEQIAESAGRSSGKDLGLESKFIMQIHKEMGYDLYSSNEAESNHHSFYHKDTLNYVVEDSHNSFLGDTTKKSYAIIDILSFN